MRFPLLLLAYRYLWSRRDPLIFWMHQFSLWCLILTMGLMLALFSIMNGVEERIEANIRPFYGDVLVTHQKQSSTESNDVARHLETLRHQNKSMPSAITLTDGALIEVRAQNTVIRNPNHSFTPVIVERSTTFAHGVSVTKDVAYASRIDIYDVEQYNTVFGTFRHKQWPVRTVMANGNHYIYMGYQDYDVFFKNASNVTAWRLFMRNYSPEWLNELKKKVPIGMAIYESRRFDDKKYSAIAFQKNIFTLVYTVLFVLMTAITLSINVAFFKDKRKDWALLTLMNTYRYPVEKIFFYKNSMTLAMAIVFGTSLGILIAHYANDVIQTILTIRQQPFQPEFFFGETSIPYQLYFSDWLLLVSCMSGMMIINTIVLIYVFRRENTMQLLKLGS